MSQSSNKEFAMAVGTSSMLEPNMMEGENFYTPMETSTQPEPEPEPEQATQNNWSNVKNDTGQLCRACANTSDYLIPIFEGEGLEHQLETKITKHLPIQVTATDTLPLQLCYQCASTLIAWDTMINSCIEADKKLRAMQEAAGEEIKDTDDFDSSHIDNDTIDSDDEPLITSKAKLAEKKKVPIKKKILSKAKSKNLTVKNDKTASDSKEGEEKERNEDQCDLYDINEILDFCRKKHEAKAEDWNEGEEPEEESDACTSYEIDEKDISSIIQEANKIRRRRMPDNVLKGSTPYTECPVCDKVVEKGMITDHMIRDHHLSPKKSQRKCHLCGKTFGNKNFLQRHVQSVHEKLIRAKCATCGKLFTDSSNYRQHLLIHTGVKSYICQICGKGFVQSQGLRMHMPSHSDDYPFSCSVCTKSFRRKQHYELHMIKHTGKKTHQCEICGKFFSAKCELKMHSWIHKKEWPFQCQHCNKGFNQSYGLKLHIKNHHTLAV